MAFLAVLLARVFGINWEELHPADRARLDGKFGEFLDKMALIGIILISFWWQGKDMKVGCVVVGDFLLPHPTPPKIIIPSPHPAAALRQSRAGGVLS